MKQFLGLLAPIALAVAGVSAGSASAATRPTVKTLAEWQAAIAQVPERGTGCYHASYPALQWHAVACVAAPKWPLAPALLSTSTGRPAPLTVGNGHDYSAKASGLISKATGSFDDVSSSITEKGKVGGKGSELANTFSLQLNTEFFSTPACSKSGDPSKCLGWQQFLYDTSENVVFMQYWLINYGAACPSGWFSYSPDCYTNSSASSVTGGRVTAKDLATVKLSGTATSGGSDKVSLSDGSGQASLASNTDSKLHLSAAWKMTEWGVFGDGGGSEAYFGAATTLDAQTTLTATSSSAPTCVKEGFTAETNNLTLASTPGLGTEPSPTMVSKQTNGSAGTASCAVAAGPRGSNPVP